ncbi:MAG: hypothetical protein J2P27_10315 [Actinobacteria bacterium]|nr:hypothetical protein [Actinomycetota bacterium]
MGIPQFPDQVRKAPTLALRAVFAGIGKILLAADRPPAGPDPAGPKHAAPVRRPPATPPPPAAAVDESQRWRSLDETGNVRLLSAEELATGHGAVRTAGPADLVAEDQTADKAEDGEIAPVASQPLGGNVPIGASLVIHAVPIPGYDTISVASIRARLRGLDFDELQALLLHEHKNLKRPEVIAMIERRIAKLESGG